MDIGAQNYVANVNPQGIRVVSPTFPFATESFRPLSLSPRVVSPPGRFAHFPVRPLSRFALFPVRPWVVSPPYKILFLLLLFRPQKWYKTLFFLAYWWFFVITYKRWKKLSILCGILKSNPAVFVCQPQSWFILSILRPYIAWASETSKKRILCCSNFKYFLFLSFPLSPWTFQFLRYICHFHVFVSQKLSTIKLALDGID